MLQMLILQIFFFFFFSINEENVKVAYICGKNKKRPYCQGKALLTFLVIDMRLRLCIIYQVMVEYHLRANRSIYRLKINQFKKYHINIGLMSIS